MVAKKTDKKSPPKKNAPAAGSKISSSRSTVSGPSGKSAPAAYDAAAKKMDDTNDLVSDFPHNENKPFEYGQESGKPKKGKTSSPATSQVT
ncbi:MAG: hypothetical protein EOP10_26250, partial [Proteobacteria bacterium]